MPALIDEANRFMAASDFARDAKPFTLKQIKASNEATANVTVLEGLKARCTEGSSWANKIEKLLKGQRKKAAREQPN